VFFVTSKAAAAIRGPAAGQVDELWYSQSFYFYPSGSVLVPRLEVRGGGTLHTFPDKLGPLDAPPYLGLVRQSRIGTEGLVEPRPEVCVAEGVLSAQMKEFYALDRLRGQLDGRAFQIWEGFFSRDCYSGTHVCRWVSPDF
jgi:hypothetical protein